LTIFKKHNFTKKQEHAFNVAVKAIERAKKKQVLFFMASLAVLLHTLQLLKIILKILVLELNWITCKPVIKFLILALVFFMTAERMTLIIT